MGVQVEVRFLLCRDNNVKMGILTDPSPASGSAGEADLRSFLRIFIEELQRGFFEKHVWLSLWDRPPRSRFTRVQRASCCCLLVFLFLCANAVWYGIVGDVNFRCVGNF